MCGGWSNPDSDGQNSVSYSEKLSIGAKFKDFRRLIANREYKYPE